MFTRLWTESAVEHYEPSSLDALLFFLRSMKTFGTSSIKMWWDEGWAVNSVFPSCSAASALTYFGICMNIGSFGVGVYSAQFFSGLSEAPCLLIPLVRLGRRPLSMLALFLSGAACFLSLLLSRYNGEILTWQHVTEFSTCNSSHNIQTRVRILDIILMLAF